MGIGRIGKFWVIEYFGVEFDFIQFGKVIGGGFLLVGVIYRVDIIFDKFGRYVMIFGGNLVVIVVGIEVVEIVKEFFLYVQEVGDYFYKYFEEFKEKYEVIGDVRGFGFVQVVEIVKSKEIKEKYFELRDRIVKELVKCGFVFFGCGDNSICFILLFIVIKEEIDVVMEIFEEVFKVVLK